MHKEDSALADARDQRKKRRSRCGRESLSHRTTVRKRNRQGGREKGRESERKRARFL